MLVIEKPTAQQLAARRRRETPLHALLARFMEVRDEFIDLADELADGLGTCSAKNNPFSDIEMARATAADVEAIGRVVETMLSYLETEV